MQFLLSNESVTTGFANHVELNPLTIVEAQLGRERIMYNSTTSTKTIKHIIEKNSSLRVGFGWSFETLHMFEKMMHECIAEISPKYTRGTNIISDRRCSWIGFLPFDIFAKIMYEDLTQPELIIFNNELISFQEDVVNFIVNHTVFRQHSLIRNDTYRFNYLKTLRENSNALEEAYWEYVLAVKETSLLLQIPRIVLEEQLGCHFLNYPALFHELVSFTKLKGDLYE